MNNLYFGDNLDILRLHVESSSVDLIYLDPPFNSDQDYNVLFREQDGTQSASQIKAFQDTWHWDESAAKSYQETVELGGKVSLAMQGFRAFLGDSDMLAYLSMMAPRLIELRRVLKPTGSIYLHCDQTASHYLKMLMDAIWGIENFRNEVIWYYYNKLHDRRKKLFARATDSILFYVKDKSSDFTFLQLKELRDEPIRQLARKKVAGRMVNVKDEQGHVIYRVKTDRTLDNVWRIPCLQPAASERLGYPTQKPEALLERILMASSRPGDVVLDPFCGCGTTIAAAQRLSRKWVGIDITHLAIALIRHRLNSAFGESIKYKTVGEPTSISDARVLAETDRMQFQWWSLGLVGGRPAEKAVGADKGIDGRLFFHDEGVKGATKQVILSVKSGGVSVRDIRDLRGVIEREKAVIGVLITLEQPTRPMRTEAASAGYYSSPWGEKYPAIQIITTDDLLAGRGIRYPIAANVTHRRAPKKPSGDNSFQRKML